MTRKYRSNVDDQRKLFHSNNVYIGQKELGYVQGDRAPGHQRWAAKDVKCQGNC